MIEVLLDGWSLVYKPESSSALHLMTLISNCPPNVHYAVALPGSPPEWLPHDIQVYEMRTASSDWGQLLWEQRILPSIANRLGVDLLHLTSPTPPLVSSQPIALSPCEYLQKRQRRGLVERLRTALASGGMSRLSALFWPNDLPPPPDLGVGIHRLPPIVHTGFFASDYLFSDFSKFRDLPKTYILYQGPVDRVTIRRLLDVWSWVDGPIGEYYPLLIVGLSNSLSKRMMEEVRLRFGLTTSVQDLSPLNPLALPLIYHRSTAVFNLGGIPAWGNAARNALASAKPFVAASSMEIEAIVGPAAYLLPEGNVRTLGAALITVVVEDSLAEELSKAARERSSAWDTSKFRDALGEAYANISPK